MIRFADTRDFDAVLALWKRCFPGDEAFTQWFFENQYNPAVTLLDEEDGRLCSMLQMLPYQLRDARGVRPVTYIYGACTAPECRRQHRSNFLPLQSGLFIQLPGHTLLHGFSRLDHTCTQVVDKPIDTHTEFPEQ